MTLRDESLPHQIVIQLNGVSCNCRAITSIVHGTTKYEMFASFGSLAEMWAAYNDPRNHVAQTGEEC